MFVTFSGGRRMNSVRTQAQIDNLAVMLRRMIWMARKQVGDTSMKVIAGKAEELLKLYGLQGSLLREMSPNADTSECRQATVTPATTELLDELLDMEALLADSTVIKWQLDKAHAEIARLCAENENLRRWKALDKPLTAAMEIANLAIDQRRAENDCLRAQRDQLLAALLPFANARWDLLNDEHDSVFTQITSGANGIRVGHVRNARAAIASVDLRERGR
jgi:hypothetical protein